MRRSPRSLVAAAALAALGCRPTPPDEASPPVAALDVHFAGCAEVRGGPTCAIGGPLTLWVPGAAAPGVELDGAPVEPHRTTIPGGHRLTLTPPPDAAAVEVATVDGRWRLRLAAAPPVVDLGAADAAETIARRLPTAAGAERARLLRASARLALRRGEVDRALAELLDAERAADAADLDSERRLSAATRVHLLLVGRRVVEARDALAALPEPARGDAYGAYVSRFARATVARKAGDLRAAASDMAAAAALADRVGLAAEARAARQEQGTLLGDLGRNDEAVAVFEGLDRALPPDATACERGDVLNNLGWQRVRAGHMAAAVDPIERALALYADCGQRADFRRSIARVNLALARLETDPEGAAAALGPVDAAGGADVAAWRLIVEGRLARRRGDRAAAAAIFDQLEARARAAGSTALLWRAHLEAGLTAEAGCDWPRAVGAFRRAEGLLFDASVQIAADGGRTRFLAGRGQSAAHLVRALVTLGRPGEAFDAARRARRRALLGFSQHARLTGLTPARRDAWQAGYAEYVAARAAFDASVAGDWDRSADALAALTIEREAERARLSALLDTLATLAGRAPGAEAALRPLSTDGPTLGWFPAPDAPSACAGADRARWFGFLATDGRVEAASVTLDDPIGPLAGPLTEALAAARRVELMPAGAMRHLDLHLLPVRGRPLAAATPVVWRVDGLAAPERPALGGALVVVDPRVDLARARSEGAAIVERLEATGWSTRTLAGTAVTREALRAELARVELFHYAGHAISGGLDGWQSAFLLAEGALTVGDLLTLAAGPRWAVLAGCETGRAPGDVSGIGLAHALLAVGSEAVVATARPVADDDAEAFSGAFYAALPRGPRSIEPVVAAYHRALAATPAAARGAFRLLVP